LLKNNHFVAINHPHQYAEKILGHLSKEENFVSYPDKPTEKNSIKN
jgi:hypothetical protein